MIFRSEGSSSMFRCFAFVGISRRSMTSHHLRLQPASSGILTEGGGTSFSNSLIGSPDNDLYKLSRFSASSFETTFLVKLTRNSQGSTFFRRKLNMLCLSRNDHKSRESVKSTSIHHFCTTPSANNWHHTSRLPAKTTVGITCLPPSCFRMLKRMQMQSTVFAQHRRLFDMKFERFCGTLVHGHRACFRIYSQWKTITVKEKFAQPGAIIATLTLL